MELNLLRINEFIEKFNVKQITSSKQYEGSSRQSFDQNGLFSETIFGRLGSRDRKRNYAFINLKIKFIHPEVYPILTSLNIDLTKLIIDKQKYIINQDGVLVPDEENGNSGIFYFINNFNNINFDTLKTEKPKHVKFILTNKDYIFIDKVLVLPAGYRDVIMTNTGKSFIQYGEVNDLYTKLINQTNMISPELIDLDPNLIASLSKSTQRTLNQINSWIKDRIKGKTGLVRGGLLKKSVDYSARLVIVPDNQLELGYIGLPCQICLRLFEPFFIHHVLYKDTDNMLKGLIQQNLNLENQPDVNDIKKFVNKINDTPMDLDTTTKIIIKETAEKVVENKLVVYKRDPVENRDSYLSCYIKVNEIGFVAKLNNYDLCKHGGDYDGDTISVMSILTEEAMNDAKEKMHMSHSKSPWTPGISYSKPAFDLTQDASVAVYIATVN